MHSKVISKTFKTNIIVFFIALFVAFIVIELGLRFIFVPVTYPSKIVQQVDGDIYYELKPNLDLIDYGPIIRVNPVRIKTNSYGLREDEEHSFEKPEGVFRIAMVGDSITFGMYIEQNETYSHILEEMLNEKFSENNVETLNFGVPGYNTQQEYELIRKKVIQYNPDIIILTYTPNDFYKPHNPFTISRALGRQSYIARLIFWVYVKSLSNPQQTDYQEVDNYLKKINILTQKEDIVFILTGPICHKRYFCSGEIENHFEQLSNEEGFYYFRPNATLFSQFEDKDLSIPKEGHPNKLANKLFAEDLYHQLTAE